MGQHQTGSVGSPGYIPLGFSQLCSHISVLLPRWVPGATRATSFLMVISFIPLVLTGPGLPIPELATMEKGGIAMIGLENLPPELVSIPQNKVDIVESPHVHHTSIAWLKGRLNLMYEKHLAHKACNKSQLFLIVLQGLCPSQLNNTLLLILISRLSIPKKDLRLLLLFVGTAGMAPIHLLLPFLLLLPSFNKHSVS